MRIVLLWIIFTSLEIYHVAESCDDEWGNVPCNEEYLPKNCDFDKIRLPTVEDYDRCAPARLPIPVRDFYLARSGRGITYRENRNAFKRIQIIPKYLRNNNRNSIEIRTFGQRVALPIGIAPTSGHLLAHPSGEIATAKAAAYLNTVMILSCYSTISLEEVAQSVSGSDANLWMQLYVFYNRSFTVDLVERAQKSGYKAIVLTVDSNFVPPLSCRARTYPQIAEARAANTAYYIYMNVSYPAPTTFSDIKWLKSITNLPIVVKGILTGDDAVRAIKSGASAILVSNHGGRQLDGVKATIDALPDVVRAVNKIRPRRDVYLDGGVRNGYDVYKAIARGAKMVFVGRAALWGLTLEGEEGVKKVLNILKDEFNTTMLLAGASNPGEISSNSVAPFLPFLNYSEDQDIDGNSEA